jgi:hypothetical protein
VLSGHLLHQDRKPQQGLWSAGFPALVSHGITPAQRICAWPFGLFSLPFTQQQQADRDAAGVFVDEGGMVGKTGLKWRFA